MAIHETKTGDYVIVGDAIYQVSCNGELVKIPKDFIGPLGGIKTTLENLKPGDMFYILGGISGNTCSNPNKVNVALSSPNSLLYHIEPLLKSTLVEHIIHSKLLLDM